MNVYNSNKIAKDSFFLIKRFNLFSIPFDVLELARQLNIKLFKYDLVSKEALDSYLASEKNKDAFLIINEEVNLVYLFYDSNIDSSLIRVQVTREVVKFLYPNLDEEKWSIYLATLLVPIYSLFFVEDLDALNISKIYDVTLDVASLALKIFKKRVKNYGSKLFRYEEEVIRGLMKPCI